MLDDMTDRIRIVRTQLEPPRFAVLDLDAPALSHVLADGLDFDGANMRRWSAAREAAGLPVRPGRV